MKNEMRNPIKNFKNISDYPTLLIIQKYNLFRKRDRKKLHFHLHHNKIKRFLHFIYKQKR